MNWFKSIPIFATLLHILLVFLKMQDIYENRIMCGVFATIFSSEYNSFDCAWFLCLMTKNWINIIILLT